MGQAASSSSVTAINNIITNVVQSTAVANSTTSDNNQNTVINVSGNATFDGSTISQKATVDVSAVFNVQNVSTMSDDISNQILNYAKSLQGGFAGKSDADAKTFIQNQVQSALSQSTTIDNAVKSISNQSTTFNVLGNLFFTNSSITQDSTTVAKAVVASSAVSDVVNNLANSIDQGAAATTQSPLSSILTSWEYIILFIAVVIIAVVCGALWVYRDVLF